MSLSHTALLAFTQWLVILVESAMPELRRVGKERKKQLQPIHLGCLETRIAEGSCQGEAISIRSPCQKSKQAEKVGCAQ